MSVGLRILSMPGSVRRHQTHAQAKATRRPGMFRLRYPALFGATDLADSNEQTMVQLIPALRAFARTWHPNPTDADDLVQETLTKALVAIGQFTTGTSMKSWMFTIMRNTFLTRVKQRGREAPGAANCVATLKSVEATQEWTLRGNEMRRAIASLPVQQREVVTLVALLGLEYEEAAEICRVPIGTIKSRLNRGRTNLLIALGEGSCRAALERSDPQVRHQFEADRTRH